MTGNREIKIKKRTAGANPDGSDKIEERYVLMNEDNTLAHMSNVDVFSTSTFNNCTHLVCTIGPSCSSVESIHKLISSGMNIARLNFSHGDHAYHGGLIKNIREAAQHFLPRPVAIALDTKGPEVRTGMNEANENITLVTDNKVLLTHNPAYKEKCTAERVYIDYHKMATDLHAGQKVLLADGTCILKVLRVTYEQEIECVVLCGATFGSRKNVCFPGVLIDLPALSEKDIKDIHFGLDNEIDMIFASFVRTADNLNDIRTAIKDHPRGPYVKIVSKIENFQGVQNIDTIIDFSDGIMIARGDLGMDLPLKKVLAAQKQITAKCITNNKPVICATQMMESMIQNRRPTRAEVSDIGNAVLDGVDCVMLSGETANGRFPVDAVKKMRKICRETEALLVTKTMFNNILEHKFEVNESESVSMASVNISFAIRADAIIVLSTSGTTAQLISHYRPQCPIITITRSGRVARQLQLCRGLYPLLYTDSEVEPWELDIDARLRFGIKYGRRLGMIRTDSYVVFICGWQKGSGFSNTLRILKIGEDETIRGLSRTISEVGIGK